MSIEDCHNIHPPSSLHQSKFLVLVPNHARPLSGVVLSRLPLVDILDAFEVEDMCYFSIEVYNNTKTVLLHPAKDIELEERRL